MNIVSLVFGLLLVTAGFVALVRKVHDRSIHESLAQLRFVRGDTGSAVTALAGLLVPIVSSIAGGVAFLVLGVMGGSLAPTYWW